MHRPSYHDLFHMARPIEFKEPVPVCSTCGHSRWMDKPAATSYHADGTPIEQNTRFVERVCQICWERETGRRQRRTFTPGTEP